MEKNKKDTPYEADPLKPLIAALKSGFEDKRKAAAIALGQTCDIRAVEPAIQAPGQIGGTRAVLSAGVVAPPDVAGVPVPDEDRYY